MNVGVSCLYGVLGNANLRCFLKIVRCSSLSAEVLVARK